MKILFACDKLTPFILNDIACLSRSGYEINILSVHRDKNIFNKIIRPYLIEHGLEDNLYLNWKIARDRTAKLKNLVLFALLIGVDFLRKPRRTLRALPLLFRFYNNIWQAFENYNYLRNLLNKDFDIIHVPFSTPVMLKQVYFIAKYLEVPYVLSFRAHDLYGPTEIFTSGILNEIVAQASAFITISEFNKKALLGKLGTGIDVEIIHGGVDTTFFVPESIDKEGGRIVAIGRLHEQKGFTYLLEACELLSQRDIHYECLIVGEGPEQNDINKTIRDKRLHEVKLIDYLDREGVRRVLAKAAIFVLPCVVAEGGLRDILPNAVKEAMAMELPIVTSNISGIEELVIDGRNGLLTQAGDSHSIADALETLLKNEQLRYRMGKKGREHILKHFNVEAEAGKLANIFCSVAGVQ